MTIRQILRQIKREAREYQIIKANSQFRRSMRTPRFDRRSIRPCVGWTKRQGYYGI